MQLTPINDDDRCRQVVVVSPHPDDSEIGAAGLVHRLARDGWHVMTLVMTDEANPVVAGRRRAEMLSAARAVGVAEESVIFAGFADGSLHASSDELTTLRKLVASHGLQPDLIVVNHRAERHTDHRATSALIENLFIGIPTLEYVVGNHLDTSQFRPSVFVELSDDLIEVRRRALAAHASQVECGRVRTDIYRSIHQHFAREVGLDLAEPFEARNMTRAALQMVGPYNASLFERLWVEAFDGDHLLVLHGSSRYGPHREALDDFRFVFRARSELPTITMRYADQVARTGRQLLASGDVLLVDGPFRNPLTDRYLNHLGVRYQVTFTEPGATNPRIWDCLTGETLRPTYVEAANGRRIVVADVGLVTVMPNPYALGHVLVAVAGATAVGTTGLLRVLLQPTREVFDLVSDALRTSHCKQGLLAIEPNAEGRLAPRLLDVHSGVTDIDGVAGL